MYIIAKHFTYGIRYYCTKSNTWSERPNNIAPHLSRDWLWELIVTNYAMHGGVWRAATVEVHPGWVKFMDIKHEPKKRAICIT